MPPLDQVLPVLSDYIKDHAVKILSGLMLMAFGWWIGFRRAKANWKKREFYDRLNVSLNYIEDGMLMIRTLSEKNCEDVFLNTAAAEAVKQAAKQTTAADPLLPLPKEDYWYYLNSVLNDLSERFAVGALRKEQGSAVHGEKYLVSLTSETTGEIRMRKVRAMVVRKSLLLNLLTEPATPPVVVTTLSNSTVSTPKFASPNHTTRWHTLLFLAAEYQRNPWRFIEVELCA